MPSITDVLFAILAHRKCALVSAGALFGVNEPRPEYIQCREFGFIT
jgi:hypothetical protein